MSDQAKECGHCFKPRSDHDAYGHCRDSHSRYFTEVDYSGLTDEVRELLRGLEVENLLPKGVTRNIASAMRVAKVVGAKRTKFLGLVGLAVLACFLGSGGVAAPFDWLKFLLWSLAAVSAILVFVLGMP